MRGEHFEMFDVSDYVSFVPKRRFPHLLILEQVITPPFVPAQKLLVIKSPTILLQSGFPPSVISYPPCVIDPNRFQLGYLVGGKETSPRLEETNTILSLRVLGQLSPNSFVSLSQPNRI
jgi:hypothetical protein